MEVICSYCRQITILVKGSEIYKKYNNPYSEKYFYYCKECDAYVGCHPGTKNPLGTVANKRLRQLRKSCHNSFDKIWKNKYLSRSQAYRRTPKKMGRLLKKPSFSNLGTRPLWVEDPQREACPFFYRGIVTNGLQQN